jgi:CheY-like chemotaxis protein
MTRVLVVEDNPDTRLALKALLEEAGHAVSEAYSGSEAVETAVRVMPDIVLLDLRLPDMTGEEVLATLRTLPGTTRTPVIVVSAKSRAEDIAIARSLGADGYVVKPWGDGEVEAAIDKALALHPPWTRAASPGAAL